MTDGRTDKQIKKHTSSNLILDIDTLALLCIYNDDVVAESFSSGKTEDLFKWPEGSALCLYLTMSVTYLLAHSLTVSEILKYY